MASGLRARLLLLVLVAVVPALAIGVLWARAHERLLVEKASEDAGALAQLAAERAQRSLDAARGVLLGLSRMRSIAGHEGAVCSARLAPLVAHEPEFTNMGAVDAAGRVFCSAAPSPRAVDLSDRAFYREALRTGGLGVGEYVVSRVSGRAAVSFGYPVVQGGRVVAVAFATLAVERLQGDLDALAVPPSADVAVLDRRGVAISARPGGAARAGRPFDPALLAAVRGAGGRATLPGEDGRLRSWALRTVRAPDGTAALQVLAGISADALLAPVRRVSARALLASALAAALALGAAALVGEFALVRPLRRLAAAARRIAGGDWSARSGLRGGGGELGELIGRFDEMARSLEGLDREKRRREEQLRQAQKMEVVGRLAGGVAHDFNNLLTVILSATASLQETLPEDHPAQRDARDVAASAEQAAALTRRLLAFARRRSLLPRAVDLGRAARQMEKMLRRLLGEDVALSVDVRRPVRVHADQGQLELALLNLAVNARDAMPSGGHLLVVVDLVAEDDPRRPAGDVPPGPLALLSVKDDGVGMDDRVRDRIFEPFFTTKSAGRGTGLGLSTVADLVTQGGGAVRVTSAPGEGTEFRIYLPAQPGGAAEGVARPTARAPGGTERLLLVEDEGALRGIVQRLLIAHGYRVAAASSAAHARELAAEGPAPDVLVTDVILPDGSGVELARELGRRWPGLPVLLVSGYGGESLPPLDALPPEARFLPKPFTPDVLLLALRAVLDARAAPAGRTAS